MYYIALVTKEKDKYTIYFPRCLGCQTFVEEHEDIQDVAAEAVEGWLESQMDANRDAPYGYFDLDVENSVFELPAADGCSIMMPVTVDTALVSKIIAYNYARAEKCR